MFLLARLPHPLMTRAMVDKFMGSEPCTMAIVRDIKQVSATFLTRLYFDGMWLKAGLDRNARCVRPR